MLLVDDVQRACDYYQNQLGFEVSYYKENPRHYGYASRDSCHVHFACFHAAPPRPNSAAVPPDMFDLYIYVDDLESLHAELVKTRRRSHQRPGRP